MWALLFLFSILLQLQNGMCFSFSPLAQKQTQRISRIAQTQPLIPLTILFGWIQFPDSEEWEWQEDDPKYVVPSRQKQRKVEMSQGGGKDFGQGVTLAKASATPQLPSGLYKPKQSLGQNYLKDPNTVAKILRTFHQDAIQKGGDGNSYSSLHKIVELGPGAGALTDKLVETYGVGALQCIEIDERSIDILREKYPDLNVEHADVLQVDYAQMANKLQGGGEPLVVIGNLPYYITSQILFALADASHVNAVRCATVTMQWEVGQRIVAKTCTKDYGILSVVFQLYANVKCHFKIPPTVFYPKPKVDSALIGLNFLGPSRLERRLAGVQPVHLRRVLTACFQQRRKTVRNSLKKLVNSQIHPGNPTAAEALLHGPPLPLPASIRAALHDSDRRNNDQDAKFFATQQLPDDWASKRPEELTPGQFVELTRLLYGPADGVVIDNGHDRSKSLGVKVWRKMKHGANNS